MIAGGSALAALLAVGITLAILQPWAKSQPNGGASGNSGLSSQSSSTVGGGSSGRLTVSATCESASSRDAGGNPTSYEPEKAVDGQPETAWRCDGDGVGQSIRLAFGSPVSVSSVGLIPGLAKTDGYDGTDRYLQNRRISAVTYAFDDGTSVTQNLDTSAGDRSVQKISFPTKATQSITITILGSVEGSQVGNLPPTEKVAISEIVVST